MQNHRLNGQGTLTYDNGDTYTGEFKNGSFNGQGTFKSHEGWIYQGEFKSGQADGQGKLTTENKVTYKGKFKQGIFKRMRINWFSYIRVTGLFLVLIYHFFPSILPWGLHRC